MSAKADGPKKWIFDFDDGTHDQERLQAIKNELGEPLLIISQWTGLRAAEGDRRSIFLLIHHLAAIFQAVQGVIENSVADYRKN